MTTTEQKAAEILQALQAKFPESIFVTPGQAMVATGLTASKDPETTARIAIHRKTFPFPSVTIGRSRRVLLSAIAEVVANAQVTPAQAPFPSRSGSTRPAAEAA